MQRSTIVQRKASKLSGERHSLQSHHWGKCKRKVICGPLWGRRTIHNAWKRSPLSVYRKLSLLSQKKKDTYGSVWRGIGGSGDEAMGSWVLGGLFEDYEDVHVQSRRPGVLSWGLWRLLDQLCIPVKRDGQVKFTNDHKWKTFVGWKLNLRKELCYSK